MSEPPGPYKRPNGRKEGTCSIHFLTNAQKQDPPFPWRPTNSHRLLKGLAGVLRCSVIGSLRCCRRYLKRTAYAAAFKSCEDRICTADWIRPALAAHTHTRTHAHPKGNQSEAFLHVAVRGNGRNCVLFSWSILQSRDKTPLFNSRD